MRSRIASLFLFIMLFSGAKAQESQVLYFMNLPQNHLLNPAIRPASTLYVGLPVLTGVNLNISNNYFNFSDIFSNGLKVSESTIPFLNSDFNVAGFLDRIKEHNYLETQAAVQLFGFGLTVGHDLYLFMDINDHINENIVFPRSLLNLAFNGNQQYAGQTFDLSGIRAGVKYYHEIGFGFSKNITQRLRIGAKGKLLFGVADGSFVPNSLKLTVNNDYTNTLFSDININISGPVNFYTDSENKIDSVAFDKDRFNNPHDALKFITNTGNKGVALDIGAEYEINNSIVLSASVTDLGFINWKTDTRNLKTNNIIELKGLDFADIYNGTTTIDDLAKGMVDSLKQSLIYESGKSYKTMLPFGFTVAGKYNLTRMLSFGIMSYSRVVDKQIREALSLSANMNLNNILSASLSYTASNNSYSNLGFGLAVRGGFAQFYFLLDRIPLTWNKVSTGDHNIPVPANWNTLNTWVGMNFVFGYNSKKVKDKPMVAGE